jgi:hypothetical protein
MKQKIIGGETLGSVVRRFPHLETELNEMVEKDESFRQLCQDYRELVSALKKTSTHAGDTKADLIRLRTSLEVEILEKISRKGALERN